MQTYRVCVGERARVGGGGGVFLLYTGITDVCIVANEQTRDYKMQKKVK